MNKRSQRREKVAESIASTASRRRSARRAGKPPHLGDFSVQHGNVSVKGRHPGTIDNAAVLNDKIVTHGLTSAIIPDNFN
jgi:hypothetical protein